MDDHGQVKQPKTFAKITPELKAILNETKYQEISRVKSTFDLC